MKTTIHPTAFTFLVTACALMCSSKVLAATEYRDTLDKAVAGPDARASGHPPLRNRANRGHAHCQRPRRRDGVAAKKRAFEADDVGAESLGEGREPFVAPVGGQRERQQKSERPSGLGRKIGQIHAQRLAGDCPRGIVGKEMDTRNQRVGRQHKVFAGRRSHQRGVVAQAQARRPRQRREVPGDEIGFAEARRHEEDESRQARRLALTPVC